MHIWVERLLQPLGSLMEPPSQHFHCLEPGTRAEAGNSATKHSLNEKRARGREKTAQQGTRTMFGWSLKKNFMKTFRCFDH